MSKSSAVRIKTKRNTLGLTQKELAIKVGLNENGERTVRGWESGQHKPSEKKLAEILSIDAAYPFKHDGKTEKFRFIDLFAGIGGIRLPFQQAGGKCVFSSEWDRFSQQTYHANFGEMPSGDIVPIKASEVPAHDVLLAGFPCQAFSQAGLRKGFSDTRGTMFFEIQKILAYHKPKAFLLENVKQLKGHNKGETLKTILSILRGEKIAEIPNDVNMSEEARESLSTRLNYEVDFRVISSNLFGVPQKRERIYIVGFNKDKFSSQLDMDKFFSSLEKFHCETVLGDVLEENCTVDEKHTISDRLLAGHERRKREHKAKGNGFGFSLFDKTSKYCNTISARYYKDGSEVLIDQSDINANPRKLTPRECARIQGFPENYIVDAVSNTQIYRQFGNSVSMPVISAIAQTLVDVMLSECLDSKSKLSK